MSAERDYWGDEPKCVDSRRVRVKRSFLKCLCWTNTGGWEKSEMRYLFNSFLKQCWFGTVFSTQWLVNCTFRCWSLLRSPSLLKIKCGVGWFFFCVCVWRFQVWWKIKISFLCGFFRYLCICYTICWGTCSHSELCPTWCDVLTFFFFFTR